MAGSVFGNIFKISTWGESHGEGLGVVIDGCPAGLPLCEEDIQEQLDRRKPGQSKFTHQERKMMRYIFFQVYLKARLPGLQYHLQYIIRHRGLLTIQR